MSDQDFNEDNRESPKELGFPDITSIQPSPPDTVSKLYQASTCDYGDLPFDFSSSPPQPLEQQPKQELKKQHTQPVVLQLSDLNSVDFSGGRVFENLLDMAEKDNQDNVDYNSFLDGRVIDIDEPDTINENFLTSYKLYTIRSKKLKSSDFDTCVFRRFSDFEFLQQQLLTRYGGCIIPVLPEKNFWTCLNLEGSEYVKMRLRRLLKYLNSLLNNPSIRLSRELRLFLFVDGNEFSELKGEFQQKVKLQDKFYSFLSSAAQAGQNLLASWWSKGQQQGPTVLQSSSNLALAENQVQINSLAKAVIHWRKEITFRKRQFTALSNINISKDKRYDSGQFEKLEQLFEVKDQLTQEMAEYIESCRQALNRRNSLALQLDNLRVIEENTLKKHKNNPRSKEIDLVKTKIKKSQETLERWTNGLLEEIGKAVHHAREQYNQFLTEYIRYRHLLYKV